MPIFKKEKLKMNLDKKVLGVYVPLNFLNYLGLYCIAHSSSKSFILSGLLKEWEGKQREINDEESLIKQIVCKILNIYSNPKIKKPVNYRNTVIYELTKIGITQSNIDKIIKQFLDEKSKK